MSENSCQQLRGELQEIKDLKSQFDTVLNESVQTGNLQDAYNLREQLEQRQQGLREKLWPFKELTRENVASQYESQVTAFKVAEVVKQLPGGEFGIIDIKGISRPMPKLEVIIDRLREQRAELAQKLEQGFVKILVVPVGMKLGDLIAGYKKSILDHKANHQLLDKDGQELDLDTNEPVWVWDKYNQADENGSLVYDVKEFSSDHQGKEKAGLIQESESTSFPGWRVILVEDQINLPQANEGEAQGGREPLRAGKTPSEYLGIQGRQAPYDGEQGLYPEDFITLAMTQLEQTNQVLDEDTATYCTGSYFPAAGRVPAARWFRGYRRAYLSGSGPDLRDAYLGARSAVRVA
ncbi:MAG: hypothetical protein WCO52_04240 [bacterium]